MKQSWLALSLFGLVLYSFCTPAHGDEVRCAKTCVGFSGPGGAIIGYGVVDSPACPPGFYCQAPWGENDTCHSRQDVGRTSEGVCQSDPGSDPVPDPAPAPTPKPRSPSIPF